MMNVQEYKYLCSCACCVRMHLTRVIKKKLQKNKHLNMIVEMLAGE